MVLPRSRCALSGLEYHLILPMPDMARKAPVPRADLSRPYRILEPTFHEVPAIIQVAWANAGIRPAAVGSAGETAPVLVVCAADVSAGFGYFDQIDSIRRRDDPARLRIVPLVSRLTHDSSSIGEDDPSLEREKTAHRVSRSVTQAPTDVCRRKPPNFVISYASRGPYLLDGAPRTAATDRIAGCAHDPPFVRSVWRRRWSRSSAAGAACPLPTGSTASSGSEASCRFSRHHEGLARAAG